MLDIAIFGTGSTAERAFQAAAARTDVNIICFADNDERKHGTTCHGRPVIGAAELLNTRWDVILIASMYATQIREQLTAMGIEGDKLVSPEAAAFGDTLGGLAAEKRAASTVVLDDGRSVPRSELPSILILTYETLNSTHGTGVLLQRYFASFPQEKLFSLCHTATGQPWLKQSCVLPGMASKEERAEVLAQQLRAVSFQADLVYATAFNELDLDLLETVRSVLPEGTPVIQHFMDYMPHDSAAFDARFRAMEEQVAHVWALTDGLTNDLARRYGRRVELVTALHQSPSATWKTDYAEQPADVRAIILGNLWQPWTLPVINRIWGRCRAEIPGLRPIDWYVHPARVQSIVDAGYEVGDHVVWRGFYSGQALQERLRQAELAILPFNISVEAADGYTRFSLPSRLTELCGAALPIFALASSDTEPARFLAAKSCGLSGSGADEDAVVATLVQCIRHRAIRVALGKQARHIAETEFAFDAFHAQLLGTLMRIAARVPLAA